MTKEQLDSLDAMMFEFQCNMESLESTLSFIERHTCEGIDRADEKYLMGTISGLRSMAQTYRKQYMELDDKMSDLIMEGYDNLPKEVTTDEKLHSGI